MALAWLTLVLVLKPRLQGLQAVPRSPSGERQSWPQRSFSQTIAGWGWGSFLCTRTKGEGLLVWKMTLEEGRWGLWVWVELGLGGIWGLGVHRVLQLCPVGRPLTTVATGGPLCVRPGACAWMCE